MQAAILFLEKRSKASLITFAVVLVAVIGMLDYLTGAEISVSILYLIPIAVIAWLLGTGPGVILSACSATVWFLADLFAGHVYSSPSIPYWNASVRLGFFLVVSYTVSSLRAAEKRQDEMLHFLVHDLRAPLANIVTGLQTLQETRDPAVDDDAGELIETCLASCNRMFILIDTLLDLGRLQAGRMPVQLNRSSLDEIIAAASGEVNLWAKRKGVTLESYIAQDAHSFYGDAMLTTRVLVNLLGNSIKYSPNGSSIVVHASRTTSNKLVVSVEDQGSGISREFISKMFDKYTQSYTGVGEKAVGTGIGLSFIREAVEAQGGHVFLEHSSSEGTRISFELPGFDGTAH